MNELPNQRNAHANRGCTAYRSWLMTALVLVLMSVSLAACRSPSAVTPPALNAAGSFQFSDWAGPELTVWTYLPPSASEQSNVMFIMHGAKRNPRRYRDDWIEFADQLDLILVAPEFTKDEFPTSRYYNSGGIYNRDGSSNPKSQWSYSAIEPIFDAVKRRTPTGAKSYSIYGHSAGAQFVHRFLYFIPEARVSQAIAANAGWYTMPQLDVAFPYGLHDSPATDAALTRSLNQRLLVLLGTEDTNTAHSSLRRTPKANAQGAHRFERGQTFFKAGAAEANTRGTAFGWQIGYAPGVGHSNAGMAAAAAARLAQSAASGGQQ